MEFLPIIVIAVLVLVFFAVNAAGKKRGQNQGYHQRGGNEDGSSFLPVIFSDTTPAGSDDLTSPAYHRHDHSPSGSGSDHAHTHSPSPSQHQYAEDPNQSIPDPGWSGCDSSYSSDSSSSDSGSSDCGGGGDSGGGGGD